MTITVTAKADNVTVRWWGFDKMYMVKDITEYKLYQIIHHFSERKIIQITYYLIILNKVHLFMIEMEHVRTCKIFFLNECEI